MGNPRIGASSLPMSPEAAADRVTAFLRKVYGWMAAGLAITALTALQVAGSPAVIGYLVSNQVLFLGLILAEVGLVFFLSARADRLAPSAATALFVTYAALNGVTLSFVLLAYTGESVASTFMVTAGMFGAMAVFGSTTTRRLAGFGQFLCMGGSASCWRPWSASSGTMTPSSSSFPRWVSWSSPGSPLGTRNG